MKKIILALLAVALMAAANTAALATTFTFKSNDGSGTTNDMNDLEHGYYYGWSLMDSGPNSANALGKELVNGASITSAKLIFTNIYNWTYEANDQLNSFLLAGPPPMATKSQVVPVSINGVPQGHDMYTYTMTTVTTSTACVKTTPNKYSPPAGYVVDGYTSGSKMENHKTVTYYTYTNKKTTVSTKTGTSATPPSGYVITNTKFIQDTTTVGAGIKLSNNLWERADQQNIADIDWGTEAFRIQDKNNDPHNPWHDNSGGQKKNWELVYDFNEDTIDKLFEYSLNGSFGVGIDPDCHYYNTGIRLEIETAPVPEPSTFLLLGAGLLGAAVLRRRNRA